MKKKNYKVLLSYCTVLRFFCLFFLKGTVWGVVGHEHQCAFFCVFFEKVLWEGGRRGWGGVATHHTPEQSQNRRLIETG